MICGGKIETHVYDNTFQQHQMWGRVKGAFSAAKAFATLSMDIGRDNEPENELMAAMTDELDMNNNGHSTQKIESDELRKSSKVMIA